MAKKKPMNPDDAVGAATGGDKRPKAKGSKPHHPYIRGKGGVLLDAFHPAGQPYNVEFWLMPDRRMRILQVYDEGRIVAYDESAAFDDPSALGH